MPELMIHLPDRELHWSEGRDARRILHEALDRQGLRILATRLFTHWPSLRDASVRLARQVTDLWPDGDDRGAGLLDGCLAAALASSSGRDDESGQRLVFVEEVVRRLPSVLGVTLIARRQRRAVIYDPMESPLLDWLHQESRDGRVSLAFLPEPHPAWGRDIAAWLLAARVFTLRDLEQSGALPRGAPIAGRPAKEDRAR